MPHQPPSPLNLPPDNLEGVSDDTWMDVIRKMEEVYAKLVTDAMKKKVAKERC